MTDQTPQDAPAPAETHPRPPNLKEWLLAPEARTETLTPPRRQLRRRPPPRLA